LTTQVQPAGACTTRVCAPTVVCAETDCPDAPVSLIAGLPAGDDPTGDTDTWNDGPEAGAGVQLNAQPIFQLAAVVVNAGLVQFPCICVGPRSTRAGPAGAAADDVVVDPPTAVVVVVADEPAVVVDVEPSAAAVVVVVDPLEPGSLYAGAFDASVADPPVVPFTAKPTRSAMRTATTSCQVLQLRRSLMWSSPGVGMTSSSPTPGPD
jgi:hypothetical protein